jgi:hypothetical protein
MLHQPIAHWGLPLANALRTAGTVRVDTEGVIHGVASADVLEYVKGAGHPTHDCEYSWCGRLT